MNYVGQMLQQDELDVLYECDSLTRTFKLLGVPLEPIFDAGIESQVLRLSYTYIVKCLQTYFSETVKAVDIILSFHTLYNGNTSICVDLTDFT